VPGGAPSTGGGSTSGTQDVALFAIGGALLVSGAGLLLIRRRTAHQS
jgi:LPXTG-motif cell wall-anchored protein